MSKVHGQKSDRKKRAVDSYSLDYYKTIHSGLEQTVASDLRGVVVSTDEALDAWTTRTKRLQDERGHVFFIGNGASAAMAEHLSHDCFQNADLLTETVSEISHLTAIANDISYDAVFSYRIERSAEDKDMLVTISSSGNSPNIIAAIAAARTMGLFVVTLSGMSSENVSRKLGDLNFYVPLETYGLVESAHAILLHCWLDLFLDRYMGGRH
jgi:D-sedoheptulose 7-phosphate isomerase